MPLARIITDSADDSLELSMQLRARGFRVETVAPSQVPETPADLEVRLEECGSDEVLQKAADARESEDLWVFVAPGALDEATRPMRVTSLIPRTDVPVPKTDEPPASVRVPITLMMREPEDDPILSELEQARAPVEAPTGIHGAEQAETRASEVPVPTPAPMTVTRAQGPPEVTEGRPANVVVLPKPEEKSVGSSWIPDVPEPVKAVIPGLALEAARPVRRKAYKIALRIGPEFWRTASVAAALAVLASLGILVGVRPPSPAAASRPGSAVQSTLLAVPASAAAAPVAHQTPPPIAALPGSASVPQTRSRQVRSARAAQVGRKVERRRRPAPDAGIIAEDTVVFYDRRPVAPTAKRLPPPGTKRYSDAN